MDPGIHPGASGLAGQRAGRIGRGKEAGGSAPGLMPGWSQHRGDRGAGGLSGALQSDSVTRRPLEEIIDPGWAEALAPVADRIAAAGDFLRAEVAAGRTYLPAGDLVLRAFDQPVSDVRVLIAGRH